MWKRGSWGRDVLESYKIMNVVEIMGSKGTNTQAHGGKGC